MSPLLRRALALATGSSAVVLGGAYCYLNSGPHEETTRSPRAPPPPPPRPPSRAEMLARLRASAVDPNEEFDLLIIGGGATGAGVAVDAASRGLKVALVERDDFSSGTSSKSTKLVHGGVRYLQKAVFELDYEQYKLVKEALHERKIFLQTAPHLSHILPIMLPIYKYWQIPYYWAGCKLYDLLAGSESISPSYLLPRSRALSAFPTLNPTGLVGAMVYHDGQHNDSRMNIALILTAISHGATITNYTSLTAFHRSPTGNLTGAQLTDVLTGTTFPVRARGIINCTGPSTDALLRLDDPTHRGIMALSRGVHISLPAYVVPRGMGVLDPSASDGRVVFLLPWEGGTLAGTTDVRVREGAEGGLEDDVQWILDEVRKCLRPDINLDRTDVLSVWSGLRPLVLANSNGKDTTESLIRTHTLHTTPSHLLTLTGGKWTTYREMAREAVDEAVRLFSLQARVRGACRTDSLKLVGSEGWYPGLYRELMRRYGVPEDVARHLARNYGDRAFAVLGAGAGGYTRLSPSHPFIEHEITYALHYEYAQTPSDVLFRRTRLGFLDEGEAGRVRGRVGEVMRGEGEGGVEGGRRV